MAKPRLLLLGVGLALTASAHAQAQKPLGVLFSGDASVRGAVLLRAQATEVLSGSQITAGEGTALLKLERGGQLRICPKTNLSLNAGAAGKALSLGLNTGAMELDYSLDSGADSLITPDFRLLLISPGAFHLAISVASSGDTCMRSLPGNSASVFVTEMMGSDSYQLAPGKNVLFLMGKISLATQAPDLCGCPETTPPKALVAETAPAPELMPEMETTARSQSAEEQASALPSMDQPEPAKAQSDAAAAPQPEAAHLEVESRFSYRGDQEMEDFYSTASRLSLSADNSRLALALLPQVNKPGNPTLGTPRKDAAAAPSPKARPSQASPRAAASSPAVPSSPAAAKSPAAANSPAAAKSPAAANSPAAPNPPAAVSSKAAVSEPRRGGGLRGFLRRLFGGG
jgi:hypothetical protein